MITGNQNPIAGKEEFYTFTDFTQMFETNDVQYNWAIWKKKAGKWHNITRKPPKFGKSVSFNFGEGVIGEEFRLEVYKAKKKLLSNEWEAKKVGEIFVVPTNSKSPQITKVILFNRGSRDPNKASYQDSLIAQAHCVGMFNQEVEFNLWEDDAAGGGHNAQINKNNKAPKTYKARVNEKGIAEVKISLATDERILRQIANKYMMSGDKDEGTNHEYYVTASYSGKIKGASQVNVSVKNPDYKKEAPKPQGIPTITPTRTPPPAPAKKEEDISLVEKSINFVVEAVVGAFEKIETGRSVSVVQGTPAPEKKEVEKCYCNRDFTKEEFEKIVQSLRDSEPRVKKDSGYSLFSSNNCKLKSEDKTLEKLRTKINSIFEKYEINTCLRKLHFLAQIYHETDRLRTTLEYATEKSYKPYFGRGLMQLTWKSNYELYKAYSGYDCVTNYNTIAENLDYACDTAGWFWKQGKLLSVSERWKGPSDAPSYVKVHKPDYPKKTYTLKDGNKTIKYGAVDMGLIADDDRVDIISYLVNGGANGLQERRNYVITLKNIFQYPITCTNRTNIKTPKKNNSQTDKVTIRLVRKWQTKNSTIGTFTIDNTTIQGYILEEKGPDTTVSGIEQRVPIGTYNLEWHSGSKIKKGLKLFNEVVSKSRAILIHAGNTANDTEGCLLPGSSKGVDRVNGSRDKLKEIFDHVEEIGIEDAKIIITESYE